MDAALSIGEPPTDDTSTDNKLPEPGVGTYEKFMASFGRAIR